MLKLIGSKTECDLREQHIVARDSLLNDNENAEILAALKKAVPRMKTAYLIDFFLDQDIWESTYLVSLTDIVILTSTPQDKFTYEKCEIISVKEYCKTKNKSRSQQINMAVVLDLMQKDNQAI